MPAFAGIAEAGVGVLRPFVQAWHRRALPFIKTKPFSTTWADFGVAWGDVKWPRGQCPLADALDAADAAELPADVPDYYAEEPEGFQRLLKLCRELQRLAGNKPFFLSCHVGPKHFDVEPMTIWRWLKAFRQDGVVEQVQRGTPQVRAGRYRYRGTTHQGEEISEDCSPRRPPTSGRLPDMAANKHGAVGK
jgi:hypothetical protein